MTVGAPRRVSGCHNDQLWASLEIMPAVGLVPGEGLSAGVSHGARRHSEALTSTQFFERHSRARRSDSSI